MRIFKFIAICCCALVVLVSCDKDEKNDEPKLARRTVLIYMCAENNLDAAGFFASNLKDIETGAQSLPNDVNLIVFVDRKSQMETPYIARCSVEGLVKQKVFDDDFYSVDKERMKEVMSWVARNYPAESYGLSLWGHANGWMQASERYVVKTAGIKMTGQAYGGDSGEDNAGGSDGYKYINIPELAEVISSSFPRLDFIFFDCCQGMCAEVAYELRNSCRYLIGSPAEIPGCGAPYVTVVPDFFLEKHSVGPAIVSHYIEAWRENKNNIGSLGLPLSVVDADRMNDFAQATAKAFNTIMSECMYPEQLNLKGMIYYYRSDYSANLPCFYDIHGIMQKYLGEEEYREWHDVMKQTIVFSTYPGDSLQQGLKKWMTTEGISFSSFDITESNYSGLSVFVPQIGYQFVASSYLNPNTSIFSMSWTNVVDWSKWGWMR